jgi:hypothetical protein
MISFDAEGESHLLGRRNLGERIEVPLGEGRITNLTDTFLHGRIHAFDKGNQLRHFAKGLTCDLGDFSDRHAEVVLETDQSIGRFVWSQVGALPVMDNLVDEDIPGFSLVNEARHGT